NRSSFMTYARGRRAGARLALHAPPDPRAPMRKLQERVLHGEAEQALAEFDRLLRRKGPDQGHLHAHRGEVCLWLGRPREAIRDLEASLAVDPVLRWPHVGLCGAHALLGEHAKAIAHADLALRRSHADERALWVFLGEAYRVGGEFRKALEAFRKET